MSAVCIIPARRNSKRIPGKNWKEFCGKPIILYPFETAIKSGIFDDVFVYTDSPEIKEIIPSKHIIDRPEVDDNETLAEMLLKLDLIKNYDTICVMLPTAVFATVEQLQNFNKIKFSFDSLCSVTYSDETVDWGRDIDGKLIFFDVAYEGSVFRDAGQFYFIKREVFEKEKSLISRRHDIYPISKAIDINTEEDWANAERLYKSL